MVGVESTLSLSLYYPGVNMNAAKLQRLAKNVRTGGKGSVRRKRKTVHRSSAGSDKKLTSVLKKQQVQSIPGIDEVNMFRNDNRILHFKNPKGKGVEVRQVHGSRVLPFVVQANFNSNTYVINGTPEVKGGWGDGVAWSLGTVCVPMLQNCKSSCPES